ncbi:SPARC-related modular calcium-binding protein 1-like [Argiope bruennichi]|uniref:SPARC-related modular calcium-binding protein 1-like n=1 Tax=Argiope bruennichi TaxID=94029 RepID=UPI0024941563|nr:SPARC-related modular calcium-binding protein 1-like [Argiope bruennichi]XP_055952819.1 SPARC-related modular calcium-binding protein 1-like [Argiope bruennichi]
MSRKFLFVALALTVIVHVVTADSQCQMERAQAIQDMMDGKMVDVVPRCKNNGDYKKAQCNLKKGVCFCVNQKTGERKTEEKKRGIKCKAYKS